ncbi:alpha/beta hydrolase [Rhodocaloribacter sp.]
MKGHLERYEHFESGWVEPRTVDVWLPPGYETGPRRRYPVLYMHDGQNLFDARLSFSGVAWGVNETVERMMHDGEIDGVIIVGIWNTPRRILEYMPQKPLEWFGSKKRKKRFAETYGGTPISDAYLRFIVYELKPFIDETYRTLERRPYTFMMGSSMGGLVTLYALCEYPDVFRGAACLSTSWTVGGRVMLPYLRERIPDPRTHVVYFDYGVEAHIGTYEHLQREVDALFLRAGYVRDVNLMVERFPGAPHSEAAWRERVDVPLRFLLHPRVPQTAVSLR